METGFRKFVIPLATCAVCALAGLARSALHLISRKVRLGYCLLSGCFLGLEALSRILQDDEMVFINAESSWPISPTYLHRQQLFETSHDEEPGTRGGIMPVDDISVCTEGEIAMLTLNRAHCLDIAGKRKLLAIFREIYEEYGSVRALIISATHLAAWLVNVQELADMSPAEARTFSHHGHDLGAAIAELPFPVIAAVDSAALGGGCELVLACDLALAGEHAKFGHIEAQGGVMPAFGGTWRLGERVGYQRALAMMFTAEVVDAQTAKQYGIVLEVHPSAKLMDAATALAKRVATSSRQSVAAIKRVTRAGRGLPVAALDALEEETFPQLFGPEQQHRMRAFLEQQKSSR